MYNKKKFIITLIMILVLTNNLTVASSVDISDINNDVFSSEINEKEYWTDTINTDSEECFGFIIPTNSSQSVGIQVNTSRLINELLRNRIDVYWITSNIHVFCQDLLCKTTSKLRVFEKGSFIVSFSSDSQTNILTSSIVHKYLLYGDIDIVRLNQELFEIEAYKLNEPRIAYHNGPWLDCDFYFPSLYNGGFTNYTFLTWDEIPKKLNIEDFDLFIWGYMAMSDWPQLVRDHVKYMRSTNHVRKFVSNGGGLLGSCMMAYELMAGSFLFLYKLKIYFPKLPSITTLSMVNARFQPIMGNGKIIVEIVDPESPVTYGLPNQVETKHYQGPVFINPKGKTKTIAIVKNFTDEFNPTTRLKINEVYNKLSLNKPIWITSEFGEGRIVGFGDHPELCTFNYVRIIYNSVFYLSSIGPFKVNVSNEISFSNEELIIFTLDNGTTGEAIAFNSSVENIDEYCFFWNFGDNKTSHLPRPNHIYNNPGVYHVMLTVINDSSFITMGHINITISGDPLIPNKPPNKPIIYCLTSTVIRPFQKSYCVLYTEEPDGDLFYYSFQIKYFMTNITNNFTSSNFTFASGQYKRFPIGPFFIVTIFSVRVKAIDIHGAESEWSDPLEIIVTRFPIISRFLNRLDL